MNMKKLFLLNLPYLLFVYPFDKLAQAFRLAPGADLSGKLLSIGDGFTAALSSPWLSFQPTDLLIGIAGAVVLSMAVYPDTGFPYQVKPYPAEAYAAIRRWCTRCR